MEAEGGRGRLMAVRGGELLDRYGSGIGADGGRGRQREADGGKRGGIA